MQLIVLLLPLAVVFTYETLTDEAYGHGLFSEAMIISSAVSSVTRPSHLAQLLTGLTFGGGCLISALFFAPFSSRKFCPLAAAGYPAFTAAFYFLWCRAFIWKPARLPFGSRAASCRGCGWHSSPSGDRSCKKKAQMQCCCFCGSGARLFRRILQLVDYCAHISANGPGRGHLSRPAPQKFPKPRCPKIWPPFSLPQEFRF